MNPTAILATLAAVCLCAPAWAEVIVTIHPPFSDPPFAVTPGATVSYSPANAINLTEPQIGFPQPNSDVQSDDKFGVSPNYGGTGVTSLTSRHIYEDSPEFALTVGSLIIDLPYQVEVQMMVNTGFDFYGGRFGFTSGQLTSYFYSSGGTLIATGDDGPDAQGQFQVREFDLGTQLATGGEITLYVDDFDGASNVGNLMRVTLTPVPEPSTFLMAAVGLAGCAGFYLRRRMSQEKGSCHLFFSSAWAASCQHGTSWRAFWLTALL